MSSTLCREKTPQRLTLSVLCLVVNVCIDFSPFGNQIYHVHGHYCRTPFSRSLPMSSRPIQLNPFPSKGFPIDEWNRLALDRVKSIIALSAHSAVKGLSDRIVRMSKNSTKYVLSMFFKVPSSIALYKDSIAFLFPSSESVVKATIALRKRFWPSSRQESQFLTQSKLLNLSILLSFLVQFLNSPFFPPHI